MGHKPPEGALVRHRHDGRVGQVITRFVPRPASDVVWVEWVGRPVAWDEAGDPVNIAQLEYVH